MAVDPITGALKLGDSAVKLVDSGVKIISGGQENRREKIKQQTEAIKALAGISQSRSGVQAEQEKAKGKTKMILAISVGVLLLGVVTAFVITTMKKK
jgi:hypothetical protein